MVDVYGNRADVISKLNMAHRQAAVPLHKQSGPAGRRTEAMSLITIDAALPPVPATPLARCRGLILTGTALVAVFCLGFGGWAAYAPLESAVVASSTVTSDSARPCSISRAASLPPSWCRTAMPVKAGQT